MKKVFPLSKNLPPSEFNKWVKDKTVGLNLTFKFDKNVEGVDVVIVEGSQADINEISIRLAPYGDSTSWTSDEVIGI